MASRAINTGGASAPLDLAAILSALPSLPRPILARLTARMIDRMDELDGSPDDEVTWREVHSWHPQTLLTMHPSSPDDAEDDDPGGGNVEDEPQEDGDEKDGTNAEDEFPVRLHC